MLEAVERLLVRGKDLATDCDLLTDWDLRIEKLSQNYLELPSIMA